MFIGQDDDLTPLFVTTASLLGLIVQLGIGTD